MHCLLHPLSRLSVSGTGTKVFGCLLSGGLCFAPAFGKAPSAWALDLAACQHEVGFEATGFPDVHYITGKILERGNEPLKGRLVMKEGKLSGKVAIAMDGCETGIPQQDQAARDVYLQTSKWPTAALSLSPVTVPGDFTQTPFNKSAIPFSGRLLFHGVERQVGGLLDISRDTDNVRLRFDFEISLKDFGIPLPIFLGTSLRDAVEVFANLRAKLIPLNGAHE